MSDNPEMQVLIANAISNAVAGGTGAATDLVMGGNGLNGGVLGAMMQAYNQANDPNGSKVDETTQKVIDNLFQWAEAASYFPVIGDPASLALAMMYAAKGDFENAGLNLAAAGLGIFVAGEGKLIVKGGVLTAEEAGKLFAHSETDANGNLIVYAEKNGAESGGGSSNVTVEESHGTVEGNVAGDVSTSVKIQGGKLVNADQAIIDSNKIISYALNPEHPVGGNKAKVFESALGFNQSNANDLILKIQEGVKTNTAILGKVDNYGQRVTIDMPITGPNGKTAIVRTGWIYDSGSSVPRLTTLYVK